MSLEHDTPPLLTERLYLRPLSVDDAEALHEIFSDPQVMEHWSRLPSKTVDETRAYIEQILNSDVARFRQWVAVEKEAGANGHAMGWLSLYGPESMVLGMGYIIARPYWGRGLATEMLIEALDYAFTMWGVHKIWLDIDPDNVASIRLGEKMGFQREGLLRDNLKIGDKYFDSLIMGLLASEWRRP